MTFPTVTPRIALTSNPLDDTPVYTDVSLTSAGKGRLRSAHIKRGRSHERARMDPGDMTLILRNDDGWLDAWNYVSPLYGNRLTENQSDVETDTTGFTAFSNCTLARTNAQANHGTYSLEVTTTASGSDSLFKTTTGTGALFIPPGQSVRLTGLISFRTSLGVFRTCKAFLTWYDVSGSPLSDSVGVGISAQQSVWTEASVVATAPANAWFVSLGGLISGAGTAEVNYADTLALMGGPTPLPWGPGGRSGNLQPRTKIQLRATYSAVDYDVFTGYIESIKPVWPAERYAETEIFAVDGFTVLGRTKLVDTAHYDAVLALSPMGFYRLGESGVASAVNGLIPAIDSSGNGRDGNHKQSVTFGAPGALPTEANTAIQVTRGSPGIQGGWVEIPNTACPSGTGDFSIEAWVLPHSIGQPPFPMPVDRIWHVEGVGSQTLLLSISTDGTLRFVATAVNGGSIVSSTPLTVGRWNHVVAVKSGTTGPGNWKIYIDGVDVSSTTSTDGTGNISVTANDALIGGYESSGVGQGMFDGLIDEVAIYASALSAGDVTTLFDAAHTLTAPSLAGARIDALLDLAGWPSADRDLDTGQFLMRPVTKSLTDSFLLPYLQSLEEAEGYPAALFMDGSGKVVFQDRAHSTPASSATFGDAGGELALLRRVSPPVRDDADLWTSFTAQSEDGQPQTVTDAAAVERFGPSSPPAMGSLQNADDADVLTLITDLLARYKFPADRAPAFVVLPQKLPASLYPLVLGLDINARFLMNRHTLPGSGASLALDQRIEGVEQAITPGNWETTWRTVPT